MNEERGTSWAVIIWSVLEFIGLAVWIGGLITIIGAVIPSVFNAGMETGGRLLTRVFEGYNRLVSGAIVLLVCASAWRLWAGRRERYARVRIGRSELIMLSVMIAISGVIVLWLGPESVSLQERAFAASSEAGKKEAYEAFFRTHSVIRALYVGNLALGISLVVVKVRQWVGQPSC